MITNKLYQYLYSIIRYLTTLYYTYESYFVPIVSIYNELYKKLFHKVIHEIYIVHLDTKNNIEELNTKKSIRKLNNNFFKYLHHNMKELIYCKNQLIHKYILVKYDYNNKEYFSIIPLDELIDNKNYSNIVSYFNDPDKYIYKYQTGNVDKEYLEVIVNDDKHNQYDITYFVNKLMGPIHSNDKIGHYFLYKNNNNDINIFTLENIWYFYCLYNLEKYNKQIDLIENLVCTTKNYDFEEKILLSNENVF